MTPWYKLWLDDGDGTRMSLSIAPRARRLALHAGEIPAYLEGSDVPVPCTDIDWLDYPIAPGEIYAVSDPEHVGAFQPRTELKVVPRTGPSRADLELVEHGSVLVRTPASVDDPADNTIGSNYYPRNGDQLLVPGKGGGFFIAKVYRDHRANPTVRCAKTYVPLIFDQKRRRWAVRELV